MRYLQVGFELDPAYTFPPKMVAPGSDIDIWFREVHSRPPFVESPLPESRMQVFIDGRAAMNRSSDVR